MPVKVRCPNCRKVLSVPDRARGKAVQCPECESKIRVPAASAAAGKKGARRPGPAESLDDFAALDLRHVEDERARICPKCAADLSYLEEDETECPQCGYDPTVGGLGARAARKRRRGPDPAEFWGAAWTDSWAFLLENKRLAFKLGAFWTVFAILALSFLNIAAWCERIPPMLVWGGIGVVFALGIPGLYWALNAQIIRWTMYPDKKLDVQFDFFQNMTMGLKAVAWPSVLFLPLTAAPIGAAAAVLGMFADKLLAVQIRLFGTEGELPDDLWHPQSADAFTIAGIAVAAAYGASRLFFPLAQVHMTVRYTYKSWLPVDMLVVFFKNIAPALYWCVMWLVLFLPLVAPAVLLSTVGAESFESFTTETVGRLTVWLTGLAGPAPEVEPPGTGPAFTVVPVAESPGFLFTLMLGVSWLAAFVAVSAPVAMLAAFPSIFVIRANGLLGHYFRESLDLVHDRHANVPAGFWARYLAFLADGFILLVMLILLRLLCFFLVFAGSTFGADPEATMPILMMYGYGGLAFLIVFLYFAKQESDHAQATMGKYSIGLIVTDLKGERISLGTAAMRFFISALAAVAFPLAAFTPKKQAVQDMLTKTLVVWKGDEAGTA
ncbi:MAG: RDD family protein [Planctomycetales bacterium]